MQKVHQRKQLKLGSTVYQAWFSEALPKWFDIMFTECTEKIDKAIALNQPMVDAKYTTSAGDAFEIIYCFVVEWKLLGWASSGAETQFERLVMAVFTVIAFFYKKPGVRPF